MRHALHKLLLAGAVALAVLPVCSCSRGEFVPAGGEQKTVRIAVVLPLSDGHYDNYEAALQWAADNIADATSGLASEIHVEYEWYDEDLEDMESLAENLRQRKDIHSVIGPYSSQNTQKFAAPMRNWILPVFPLSSSEAVIRENIPAMSGGEFLWALQEADISQGEQRTGIRLAGLHQHPALHLLPLAILRGQLPENQLHDFRRQPPHGIHAGLLELEHLRRAVIRRGRRDKLPRTAGTQGGAHRSLLELDRL